MKNNYISFSYFQLLFFSFLFFFSFPLLFIYNFTFFSTTDLHFTFTEDNIILNVRQQSFDLPFRCTDMPVKLFMLDCSIENPVIRCIVSDDTTNATAASLQGKGNKINKPLVNPRPQFKIAKD